MRDLREFIDVLEEKGELLRVKEELGPRFEIAAFLRILLERGNNRVAFFERVKGYRFPVIGNVLGTKRRLAYAFGVKEDEVGCVYLERRERPVEPELVTDGPVKEVKITQDVDILGEVPVLTHHERDAGPYFTCCTVVAKDPDTGMRGMGIHRIQVKGKDRVGIFLATPPLSRFLARAEELDKPLEIAIVNGVDPLTFFASVIWAPVGVDKFAIAGGLAGKPIQLVKCESVDLEVPAWAEFVLEGYLIPGERETEGPFGESTGYYLAYKNPVGIIRAITRRREPIYHALLPFSPEEEVLLDFSWEMDNLMAIRGEFPFVRKVHLTEMGMVVIVQIEKGDEEDGRRLIEHFFRQPFVKVVIVVDEDVNIYHLDEVFWAVATRTKPLEDVVVKGDLPGLMIDPTILGGEFSPDYLYTMIPKTSKIGIDATKPLKERERFEKVDVPKDVRVRVEEIARRYIIS